MAILHHPQPSSAHVVPGMGYSMANFSLTYIVHTPYTPCTLCPTPIRPMPIMLHAHYDPSPLCHMSIIPRIQYFRCTLCPMPNEI